ncbi:hypothetical protein J4480_03135 [Candidatus Woesearchaeota archaeon]|nr:hypothetical protein [Candidatus Woesearchaeota archaeon]
MPKKLTRNSKAYYICEECGFAYKGKVTARKCESWCRKYKSCNVEITKHAVEI